MCGNGVVIGMFPYEKETLIDPKGPKSGGSRIIRGGSWDFGVGGGRLNNRNQGMQASRSCIYWS